MPTIRSAQVLWCTECPGVVPLYFICTTPTVGGLDISGATAGRFLVRPTKGASVSWAATVVSSWPAIVPGAPSANKVLIRHYVTTGDLLAAWVGTSVDVKAFLTVPGQPAEIPFESFYLPVIA